MAEMYDRKNVEKLEKDIRVHTSYRRDVLLDILHRYTHFYNPLWATDEKIIAALDEQLPDLLPAPHNIEFFVRTSERLNSLEEVLHHVESSKEMVKALGEWMGHLPDHEQLFLLWLEVCSTTSILFPDSPASKMDFERAYTETLAYMFKRKHIAGIPTSPLSRAKDKFDMILIESRDKESDLVKYDFIHPSYHEAFWYAIEHKLPLHRWWGLLKENADEILNDFENKVDMVQLRMIERYGTINRDLDQLLLISAESDDVNEQLIALLHMLERHEKFVDLPQFSNCARSVASSEASDHRYSFLNSVEKYFDQLSLDVLNAVPPLLFDSRTDVQEKAEAIILEHFDTLPESVKECGTIQLWRVAYNLAPKERGLFKKKSFYIDTFKSLLNKDIFEPRSESFDNFPMKHYPAYEMIQNVLENYDKLSTEQRNHFIALQSYPGVVGTLYKYIIIYKYAYENLPDSALVDILSIRGCRQYMVLPALLIRFERLSKEAKLVIKRLIDNPPDWRVGGSIGLLTSKRRFEIENKLSKKVKYLPMRLSSHHNKRVVGALLAGMVQCDYDEEHGLQEMYKPLLCEILRDPEAIRYGYAWMDYLFESCDFSYDEEYWSKVKVHFRNLIEKDEMTE